jgi:hypothetical protein
VDGKPAQRVRGWPACFLNAPNTKFGGDSEAWIAGSLALAGTRAAEGGWLVNGRCRGLPDVFMRRAACGIHMKNEAGEMANSDFVNADRGTG